MKGPKAPGEIVTRARGERAVCTRSSPRLRDSCTSVSYAEGMEARRIAVIEDEATIAQSVAARLRAEGFEVEVAGDGPFSIARAAPRRRAGRSST